MPVINVQAGLGDMLNLVHPQTGETIQVPVQTIFDDILPQLDENWEKNSVWLQKLTQLKDVPYPTPDQAGKALVYTPGKSNGQFMFDWSGIINFNIASGKIPENEGFVDVPSIITPDGLGDANAQARALVMRDNYLKNRIDRVRTPKEFGATGNGVVDDSDFLEYALSLPYTIDLMGLTYRITRPLSVNPIILPRWKGNGAKIIYEGPETQLPAVTVNIIPQAGLIDVHNLRVYGGSATRVGIQFVCLTEASGGIRPDISLKNVEGYDCYTNDDATDMVGLIVVMGAFDYVNFETCKAKGGFFGPDVSFSFDRSAAGIRTLFEPTFTYAPRNILSDDCEVENIWCEGAGLQEADGMSFFQNTGTPTSVTDHTCVITNYRYKNVGNRAIKLHSAVRAIIDGVNGECRSSVLPFSGMMRAAHIDAQQGGAVINNVECVFDGVAPPFLIQNYTEQPDTPRTGAISSNIKVQLTAGTPEDMVIVRHRNDNLAIGNPGNASTLVSNVVVMGGRIKAIAQLGVRLNGDHRYVVDNCIANTTGPFILFQSNSTVGTVKCVAKGCIQVGPLTPLFGKFEGDALDTDWSLNGIGCLGFTGSNGITMIREKIKLTRDAGSGTTPLGQSQIQIDSTDVAMMTLSVLGAAGNSANVYFGKPGNPNWAGISYVFGATDTVDEMSFRVGNSVGVFRIFKDYVIIGNTNGGSRIYSPINQNPEGFLTAPQGSEVTAYVAGTATKYLKATGVGNTGWVAL